MAAPFTDTRPDPPLRGTVLYIEDDPVSVELVRGMLADWPLVNLLHAASGGDGVHQVRRARPDLVLLDMNLPDIGGLEVVRQLSIEMTEHGLRVAILTGDRLNMDIIKAMSLGAYEYWVKPLGRNQLRDGLQRALSGRRADPARTLSAQR
jgi:two-component system, cell cycle response regulator DivK